DDTVLDLAKGLLRIALWSSVPFGLATVFSGAMRAAGVALTPMLLAILAIVAIELPCRDDPQPHDRPSRCMGRLSDRVLRHVSFADGLLPSGVAQADDPASDLTGSSRDYDHH